MYDSYALRVGKAGAMNQVGTSGIALVPAFAATVGPSGAVDRRRKVDSEDRTNAFDCEILAY